MKSKPNPEAVCKCGHIRDLHAPDCFAPIDETGTKFCPCKAFQERRDAASKA